LLETLAEALRDVSGDEHEQILELASMLRDFRALRVPQAREPRVSLRVFTAAAKRAVLASRALQSGLEREFLEPLTEQSLAHEFNPQRPIQSRSRRLPASVVVRS
jgi:hypothetical protein